MSTKNNGGDDAADTKHTDNTPSVPSIDTTTKNAANNDNNDNQKEDNKHDDLEINEEDLEELIEMILADPNINIDKVPDSIERSIYKTTIQLILNIVFGIIGNFNGLEILDDGHEIQLIINNNTNDNQETDRSNSTTTAVDASKLQNKKKPKKSMNKNGKKHDDGKTDSSLSSLLTNTNNIDDTVLEEMAIRFLRNDMINRKFVPDAIEESLYKNCLKVIFRILSIITSNLQVVICGHTFQLTLQQTTWQSLVVKENNCSATSSSSSRRRKTASSSTTLFGNDDDLIDEIKLLSTPPKTDNNSGNKFTNFLFDRLLNPGDHMMEKLYTTLYKLIAGIIDDMLETTSIHLLSDQIYFDVISEPNNNIQPPPQPIITEAASTTTIETSSSTTTTTTTTTRDDQVVDDIIMSTTTTSYHHHHEDEKKEEEQKEEDVNTAAHTTELQTTAMLDPNNNNSPREEVDTTTTSSNDNNNTDHVSQEDVKDLVDELLIQDPTLNIPILPDRIERMIYETVITLVLNILYGSLLGGDIKTTGLQIFASKSRIYKLRTRLHKLSKEQNLDEKFSLMERPQHHDNNNNINTTAATMKSVVIRNNNRKPNIDNTLLEQVVDILLANKSINQQYIPDQMEKLIYINCLKLIFQLLDVITTSFHICICGHDIGITLDPITNPTNKTSSSSPPQKINDAVNVLHSYVNNNNNNNNGTTNDHNKQQQVNEDAAAADDPNMWDAIVRKIRDDPGSLFSQQKLIMENIQSTLNELIIALVDNLLNQTKIQILSSTISLDIAKKEET